MHSCGFDSIPSDLSVYALYRKAAEDGTGELVDTTFVLRGMRGGVSGGTAASMLELMRDASSDPDVRRLLEDPYSLTPDRSAEPELGPQPDVGRRRGRDIAPELAGTWTTSFAMAIPNSRTVRRTNALLGWPYGRRFRYAEYMSVGSSVLSPAISAVATGASAATFGLGTRFFRLVPRGWVERIVPKPGSGPSEAARERGFYKVETYTTTTTGARYVARIAQQGDPGYKATFRAAGGERFGAGPRPRPALGSARRADTCRRDGRRASRPLPKSGRVARYRPPVVTRGVGSSHGRPR